MANWRQIITHDSLIEIDTGNAYLIRLPKRIDDVNWGVWLPKNFVRNHNKQHEIQINYPSGFTFNIATLDKDLNQKSTLKEKEIVKQFESFNLENASVVSTLDTSIDILKSNVDGIRNQLSILQETDGMLEEVENIIQETDLDNIDLLIENLNLVYKRLE